jgi:hypothetical protein
MYTLVSLPNEPKNAMALLRTCRQIYAEAALMPLVFTTFYFDGPYGIGRVPRRFKAHQRKQISIVDIGQTNSAHHYRFSNQNFLYCRVSLPRLLPGLKELRVHLFSGPEAAVPTSEAAVQALLAPQLKGMLVDVKVVEEQITEAEYNKLWVDRKMCLVR